MNYIADLSLDTSQLYFYIDALGKQAQRYNEQKKYEIAIKTLKKRLRAIWADGDAKQECRTYEALALQYFYM